jgi:hypothetical protein
VLPSPVPRARAPPSAAGCRRAGDGGGADGDDALVSPVTGSASPSPVLRARAPPSVACCLVRVSCVPGLRCWLASAHVVEIGNIEVGLGSWASEVGHYRPKFQSSQPG